jgi:diadenosine tetraphosphate (Ap4A) HIT family hydrolase
LPNLIEQRVKMARRGQNPYVIRRMSSGWLVIGDVQPLAGYCVLLADPIVESINVLTTADRAQYSVDVVRVGDALLAVTDSYRINYETLGNAEPALHTHIIPRYLKEPNEKRAYPRSWRTAGPMHQNTIPWWIGRLWKRYEST